MAANFGEAQLKLSVDIPSFRAELGQAFDAVNEWKNALVNNLQFNVDTNPLKEIPGIANEGGEAVKNLGNESKSAIDKMADFTVIKGIIDGVTNSFTQIKDYVMGFIKDFGAAEQSSVKLQNNLKNLGQQDYFSTLVKQAEDLSKITPFDDDDIINAQAMLGTFQLSGEQIQALTPRMLDLSAAYQQAGQSGMGLQQIAVMIGKGAGTEMVAGLTRVGVVMTETEKDFLKTATGMEKINALSKILDNNFKGLGQSMAGTTLGQMQMFENQMENIREEIGAQLVPVFNFFKGAAEGVMNIFKELPSTMQLAIVAIVGVGGALAALIPILAALGVASGGTLILVGAIVTALAGLGGAFIANIDSIKAWIVEVVGGEQNIQKIKETADELWNMLESFASFIQAELVNAYKDLVSSGDGIKVNILQIMESFKTLVKEGITLAREHIHSLTESTKLIIKAFQDFKKENSDLVAALEWVGKVGFAGLVVYIKGTITAFDAIINVVSRVIKALTGLWEVMKSLNTINLADLVFNPSTWEAKVDAFKNALSMVGDAFKSQDVVGELSQSKDSFVTAPTRKDLGMPEIGLREQVLSDNKKSPTGKDKGSGKGDDADKEAEKIEKEMLDDKLDALENELKLAGDVAEKRAAIIQSYQTELSTLLTALQFDENREKVHNKLVDLQSDMNKITDETSKKQKESNEKNNEMISDVTKFITDRQNKILTGIDKETADIEKAYTAMYEKIAKSKLTTDQQSEQKALLDTQKQVDLAALSTKFATQGEMDLAKLRMDNEKNDYNLKIKNINEKFKKEKDDIKAKFGETKVTEDLLKQLEIARVKEVQKVQAENQALMIGLIQSGWGTVMTAVQAGFQQIWVSVFGQANSLFEQFVQTVISKLLEIAASKLFTTIIEAVSGGGGGVLGFLGGIFKAKGGRVKAGQPYIVGEEGPESFIPDINGYILNNQDAMDVISGGIAGLETEMKPISIPKLNIPDAGFAGTVSSNIFNLGGVNPTVNNKSLSGLSQQEWNNLIDKDVLPQISQALKRIGKNVVDDTIKPR